MLNHSDTPSKDTTVRHHITAMTPVTDNSSVTNVSSQTEGSRFASTLSPTEDIMVGCYLIFVECLAVLFNGTILVLSTWKRKTLKVNDWYVVWLAMSDLGHPVVAYPMIIASSFKHAWIFGDTGCQWNAFTGFFFGVSSMCTLAVMSLNRLLIITQPNFTRHHNSTIALLMIVFTLLFALFWASCPLLGWGQYGPEPYMTSCTLIWEQPNKSFVTAAFIGCLAVPTTTMCYSYFRILHLTIRTRHKRLKWTLRNNEMRVWERKEMRLLKVTIIMCASFMICWTPYAIVAMTKSYSNHVTLTPTLSVLPALAAKTSHILDPIIYCGMNRNFIRIIPDLFSRGRECDKEATVSVPLKSINRYSVGGQL